MYNVILFRALVVRLISFSLRARDAVLDWIPVNSYLYDVSFDGLPLDRRSKMKRPSSVVGSAYALIECSSRAKDEFYQELYRLLLSVSPADVVVVVGDFKLQLRYSAEMEQNIGGQFSVPVNCTGDDEHLIHLSSHQVLSPANICFCHKKWYRLTWRLPSSSQSCTRINHIVSGQR